MTTLLATTLLAAGIFGSIGMLAWAAAALVPLLLHLWNRRQHQTAPWAAMEFLLAAVQEQAKRMRIEQILLLLLRMSIPIVLALALADPIWQMLPSLGSSLGSRSAEHHMFVIDTSYSMGYRIGDRTRLDQAKQIIGDIMDEAPQGDGFTVVAMSNPSEVVVGVPSFSTDDAMAEIANLKIRDNVANLGPAIDLVQTTLTSVRTDFPRLKQHRIYLLSDMGLTTWSDANQPSVRERIGELENVAEIITVDVGMNEVTNVGITSAQRTTPIVTPATNVTWQVSVESFIGSKSTTSQVEMLVDGKLADKQSVELLPSETTVAAFQYQFDSSGEHLVEFRIDDDALSVDNRRFEVLTVRETLQALCVEGKTGSSRNVALALAPTANSNVEVRVVPDHRLNETILTDYDVLFLCNVGRFTAERASQLRNYLRRNRGIVMFLGDQAAPENYNQLLAGRDGETAILPAELDEVAPYASYRLAPNDYEHPIIRPFRGQERSGLLTTPIWNYFRLRIPDLTNQQNWQSPSEVALKFANGDPAIVEHAALGGRFILFAIPASEQSVSRQGGQLRPWTAWSAWPSFPPMVQEALAYASAGADSSRNIAVGDAIVATLPESSGARFVTIQQPASSGGDNDNGTSQRITVQEASGTANWVHDTTYSSGVYTASIPDVDQKQRFAVNLSDTSESKLERVDLSDLPSQFQQNSVRAGTQDAETAIKTATTPLFRTMLGLLLVLLLTESFLAWYLGNARS